MRSAVIDIRKIDVSDLAEELVKAYSDYTEDVIENIEQAADDISKDALSDIKANSPKKTGSYAKGFRRVKRKNAHRVEFEIWNPKHYRRVHLLEKGWTGRNGKRVPGRAHMGPAEVKAVTAFEKQVEEIIKEGGK